MAACNGAHLHIRLSTSRLIEVIVLSAACQPVNPLCWPSVFAPAALADRRALLARIQRMHPNVQLLNMDFTAIVTMAMAGTVISLFLTWSQLAFGIFRPLNTSYHHNVPSAVTVLPWCHCTPFVYSHICLLLSPTCLQAPAVQGHFQNQPPSLRMVDARTSTFSCVDARGDDPMLGTPGGDLSEIMNAAMAIAKLT